MRLLAALWLSLALALPVWAVQPDEVLDDPVLEQRAREISKGLRCLVCRNESIDESNASLARDLRILLRDRLVAGDSDQEAVSFIVDRYGEYVLLRPVVRGVNLWLWGAGPLMLILAGAGVAYYVRSRANAAPQGSAALSEAEEKRLRDLMQE